MTAIYGVTLDDYLKANRSFFLHTTRRRRLKYFLMYWFYIPLGVLSLLGSITFVYAKVYLLACLLMICGTVLVISPWNRRRMLRRLYAQQQLGSEAELSVDDKGISSQQVDKSVNATYRWNAIKQSIESSVAFLFFPDDLHMIILPKRVLNFQQQEELRILLRQHVPAFRQVS